MLCWIGWFRRKDDPQGLFLLTLKLIRTILSGTLLALVVWGWPAMASISTKQQIETQNSSYVVAYNSPQTLKMGQGEEMYSKAYIQQVITEKSKESGIDPDLMVAVSTCESGLQMKWNSRHSEDPEYYTAYGPFQVVRSHEKTFGFDRMTLEGNIQIAIRLYLKEGLVPWKLSLKCIKQRT